MSLYRASNGCWRSPLLDAETWLDHAFGTAEAHPPFPFLVLKQVHGTRIVSDKEHTPVCEGDGLFSEDRSSFVAVKTADCIPLLLADPGRRIVAAVHGGWRAPRLGLRRLPWPP